MLKVLMHNSKYKLEHLNRVKLSFTEEVRSNCLMAIKNRMNLASPTHSKIIFHTVFGI